MTNTGLKTKFEVTGKTARDFIRWAAEKGVKVHDATVSRHLAGTQNITQPWELAYLWFFQLSDNEKALLSVAVYSTNV